MRGDLQRLCQFFDLWQDARSQKGGHPLGPTLPYTQHHSFVACLQSEPFSWRTAGMSTIMSAVAPAGDLKSQQHWPIFSHLREALPCVSALMQWIGGMVYWSVRVHLPRRWVAVRLGAGTRWEAPLSSSSHPQLHNRNCLPAAADNCGTACSVCHQSAAYLNFKHPENSQRRTTASGACHLARMLRAQDDVHSHTFRELAAALPACIHQDCRCDSRILT